MRHKMKYEALKKNLIDDDERDENNRRIIRLNVTDDSNFLSPLSMKGNPLISSETAEFLNLNIKHNLKDSGVKLIISSNVIDEAEKEVYKAAIHNYYRVEYKAVWKDLRRNLFLSIIMLLISACIFALAVILEATTNASAVILNMIDVFAWVFTWEAVDTLFLQRPKLHKEQKRNAAAIGAEIVFIYENGEGKQN